MNIEEGLFGGEEEDQKERAGGERKWRKLIKTKYNSIYIHILYIIIYLHYI